MASWRKLKTSAAPAIQPPQPRQTVHNHGTNWLTVGLSVVVAPILLLWLMWLFLAFLFWELDSEHPGQQASLVMLGIMVIVICSIVSYFLGGYFIGLIIDGKKELQQLINDGEYHKQIAAQSGVVSGRTLSEDARLMKLIMIVMSDAYRHSDLYGNYKPNESLPWSRASIKALTLAGEDKPIGESIINTKARRWLEREEVIIAGQLNLDKFPELDDVRVLLETRFNTPVKFVGNVALSDSLSDHQYGWAEKYQK